MLENIKVITSRRAYEFRPDDIRLSALCTKPLQEQFQKLFQFQTSALGTPMATFGEVPVTYPPGFVFDMGVWFTPEEQLVPIRFLHFERHRIVIDVAGPSSVISGIFEHLQHFLAPLHSPDGSPLIGKPQRVLDYSEITAKYSFPLDAMFAEPLRKLFTAHINSSNNKDLVIIPTLALQAFPNGQALAAVPGPNSSEAFTFTQRSGTQPDEHIYFSAAPLDSEAHLSYLNDLEAALRP